MEEQKHEHHEHTQNEHKSWFDKYYKLLMLIPLVILALSLLYLFSFYSNTGDFINKDVSLSGGTTITLHLDSDTTNLDALESQLKAKYPDVSFRKLTDMRTGNIIALTIESSSEPVKLKEDISSILGYALTEENTSTEFSGPSLGAGFYKQLITALIIAFILMSIVIFILFRTFIPSIAVIFAVFADIVMSLALVDYLGIKLSAAGIAAFLMLVGYSVDTDILLTTRAIKTHEGTVNSRIYGAFKTGILMTLTALFAVLPAFFIVTGLPDSFRQIFLILAIGLFADILNTWLTNAGIIKWYCVRKGIN